MTAASEVTGRPGRSRVLSSVPTRIILIILLATLPLAASAALLAWRDYQAETDMSVRRVSGVLSDYLAAEKGELAAAAASLGALGAMALSGSGCPHLLDLAAALAPGRYGALGVLDNRGRVVCTTTSLPPPRPAAAGFGRAALAAGGVTLPYARPVGPDATLVASLRLRPPFYGPTPIGTWLIAPGARPVPLADTAEPPPDPGDLRLMGNPHAPIRRSSGGTRRVYVGGALPGGNVILVGGRATRDEARAAGVLVERIAVIGLTLAAGLVLVTIGAHVTVAAPLQALTRRVTSWRTEGVFDDAHMHFVPAELAALIEAFALATRSLASREKELERARQDQELAFKEIHHRVKNNLQIIASLLNLQGNRIRQPEAKAEFQSARDRVRALATLHRHLYADAGLHTIAMRSFLLELCGQLFQAIGEREGQRIRLDVEAPEMQMSSDQAVPIALIVTEAVSNAVKYAFPGGRSGSVSVRLATLGGDRISLTIQDDGVGIPAGQVETETGVRDGLGIQLIRGFAKQLGATLEVTEGDGTRYQIELQLHDAHAERPDTPG